MVEQPRQMVEKRASLPQDSIPPFPISQLPTTAPEFPAQLPNVSKEIFEQTTPVKTNPPFTTPSPPYPKIFSSPPGRIPPHLNFNNFKLRPVTSESEKKKQREQEKSDAIGRVLLMEIAEVCVKYYVPSVNH